MRKEEAKKANKPISCFWRLIPTPNWMLCILDFLLDPNSDEEEEHFNIPPSPKNPPNVSVEEVIEPPVDKEVIPDTQRNLITTVEDQDED